MNDVDEVFYSSYPHWIKFRRVLVTIPFFLFLIVLVRVYDLEFPIPILFGSVFLGVNVWLDLRDLAQFSPVSFDAESISNAIAKMNWDDIEEAWRFGPRIQNRWQGLSRKLFFQSGIVLLSNGGQFVIFSSATHFVELSELLRRRRILIRE